MANKDEFIQGLVNSFFVFDNNREIVLSCSYDIKSKSLVYSIPKFPLFNNMENLSIGETDISLYNNLYQREWSGPVMTVRQDISHEIESDEPLFFGEKMKSLRDDLPSIAGSIKTPILQRSSLENVLNSSPKADNFSTDLFYLDINNQNLSPNEKRDVSNFLLSKNDLGKIFERKSVDDLKEVSSPGKVSKEKDQRIIHYRTLFLEPKDVK